MGAAYSREVLEYAPGNEDYEYDLQRQRKIDEEAIVDELTYRCYAHNRRLAPHLTAEQFAPHFASAAALEARFQQESK